MNTLIHADGKTFRVVFRYGEDKVTVHEKLRRRNRADNSVTITPVKRDLALRTTTCMVFDVTDREGLTKEQRAELARPEPIATGTVRCFSKDNFRFSTGRGHALNRAATKLHGRVDCDDLVNVLVQNAQEQLALAEKK